MTHKRIGIVVLPTPQCWNSHLSDRFHFIVRSKSGNWMSQFLFNICYYFYFILRSDAAIRIMQYSWVLERDPGAGRPQEVWLEI